MLLLLHYTCTSLCNAPVLHLHNKNSIWLHVIQDSRTSLWGFFHIPYNQVGEVFTGTIFKHFKIHWTVYLHFLYPIIMREKNNIYFIGNGILLLVKVAWFQSIDILSQIIFWSSERSLTKTCFFFFLFFFLGIWWTKPDKRSKGSDGSVLWSDRMQEEPLWSSSKTC